VTTSSPGQGACRTRHSGDYPIHIIVKGGKITLLGVVDSEADKTVAGMRARDVPGAFGVRSAFAGL